MRRSKNSILFLPLTEGENSPKPVARLEPLNRDTLKTSVSLSSPKGGEGWGEEASGFMGKDLDVRRSVFDVRCSQFHREGRGEGEGSARLPRCAMIGNH